MKYVNVVIDNKSNSTDNLFTYASKDDDICIGSKVRIPFARSSKLRDGYVVSFVEEQEISKALMPKIKYVSEIDAEVKLTEEMIRTAVWMRGRYLCRYIDALRCFVPAGSAPVRRKIQNPLVGREAADKKIKEMTEEQSVAVKQIENAIDSEKHDRFLIHGVTGSGKTEIYIRAVEAALHRGKGAIILVPEISLTGQIIERFLGKFGENSLAVLHSKLSPGERYDQWKTIRDGDVRIVIGARSAAFAPVENLGIIVVDEEHEATYKSDFTPKYDTVEVAMKRLQDKANNGVLVLGSATPSVVTYNRAREGIYRLIEIKNRYNGMEMPKSEIVDMREELKKGNKSVISRKLTSDMNRQLEAGRQVMLFLNRRGYSTCVSCRECGYVAECPTCGLALTYHRDNNSYNTKSGKLLCHYCGYEEEAPTACPECGSTSVKYFGTGTEKIEETIRGLFPDKIIERVDLDSVKKKGELNRKLKSFEKGKTDILIGTQIIAKGLDFKNVGLVGIISADVSLNIPDFRSPERAFQLITQASGRAGRGKKEGNVIIQTYNPQHYAIEMAAKNDYRSFYEAEDKFRRFMTYPPYSDIFRIVFTSDSPEDAEKGAAKWYKRLMELMSEKEKANLFPPQEAYMSKIRTTHRYSMIVKSPKGSRNRYAELMRQIQKEELNEKGKKAYTAIVDINPYSFT